jgi:hypothetical protein
VAAIRCGGGGIGFLAVDWLYGGPGRDHLFGGAGDRHEAVRLRSGLKSEFLPADAAAVEEQERVGEEAALVMTA